jgi:FAD/FMN-containing dehydrogenase
MLSPFQIFSFYAQRQSYWTNQQREVFPACFVKPTTAQEVSNVVKTLVSNQCQFALRSGGHSPIKEWSSIQGGVTLDLSDFKGVEISSDRKSVNLRPGNLWADVYTELEAQGLETSGGRVATVGVGGLVTGGGISYFGREKGMVCDNVLEFEVVLVNGTIVTASSTSHTDLFRALKGGSGNFGIVTCIKMKTFEYSGKMWGGTLFHKTDEATRSKLFNYYADSYATSAADSKAHWIHSWSFVNALVVKIWAVTSNIQHASDTTSTPDIFKPITGSDVTLFSTAKASKLTEQAQQMADLNPAGSRQLFATLTFRNSAAFMEEFYKLAEANVQEIRNTLGLEFTISFQSIPYAAHKQSAAAGGNSLGLEDERDDLVVALLTATWTLGLDDAAVNRVAKNLFTQGHVHAEELGVAKKFMYLNYAAQFQDPIANYGADSVARLRAIASQYDPNGVFRTLVPGGFKIPAA